MSNRGRPAKIHSALLAGNGASPEPEHIEDAITRALEAWIDPLDDAESLEVVLKRTMQPVAQAFASYYADAESWQHRVSAQEEQKDLDAILKDALYLREHGDAMRGIKLMERMQLFPPFAFAVLLDRHGMPFMDAADRLRETIQTADLDTLTAALSDQPRIPTFTKRANVARDRLAERLAEIYREHIRELRVAAWQEFIYGNEPVPPAAHAQFAEDVMRAMGIEFETKPRRQSPA